jgi:hypothetical protein
MNKIITTDYASAIVLNSTEQRTYIDDINNEARKYNFTDYVILDELKVLDPKNFGKGFGKELYLDILNMYDNIVILPSSIFYQTLDTSFCGRAKTNFLDLDDNSMNLINKFYLKHASNEGFNHFFGETFYGSKLLFLSRN